MSSFMKTTNTHIRECGLGTMLAMLSYGNMISYSTEKNVSTYINTAYAVGGCFGAITFPVGDLLAITGYKVSKL